MAFILLSVSLCLFPFRKVSYLCRCYVYFKCLNFLVIIGGSSVIFEFLMFESFYSVLALAVIDILWLFEYYNKLKVHWYVDGV